VASDGVTVYSRARSLVGRLTYRIYLRFFGGGAGLFGVSERIVEYPFAIRSIRELPAGSRVVIFGCHGDLLATLLPTLGYETHGVDIKDFPLAYENFYFRREDVRKTSFPDAYFDAVIAVSTIEHVGLFDGDEAGDARAVVEMRRVLRPRGLLVVTVPFGKTAALIPLHERVYDERQLRDLLAGLEIEAIEARVIGSDRLWAPVELELVPDSTPKPSCAALVKARKPH
jgi:SAM-dependent methyltransferase